jgi:hypothetical protein
VVYDNWRSLSILGWFFEVLAVAALVFEVYAFVDAARRPRQAFLAASKQTKPIWLLITGIAAVVGLGCAAYGAFPLNILAIAAIVAAALYVTGVKPHVKDFRGSSGTTRMGPYGPW